MATLVVGITGKICSGKGYAANYLKEKHDGQILSFSTVLREILQIFEAPDTRTNMSDLSWSLRQLLGPDVFSKYVARQAAAIKSDLVIIEGIRRESDLSELIKLPNFYLLALKSNSKIRYQRLIERKQNSGDQNKSFEEFLADGKLETEQEIDKVIRGAETIIINNSTPEKLRSKLDKAVFDFGILRMNDELGWNEPKGNMWNKPKPLSY